ncbi:hypothetical protein BDK51DRAFT_46814 [Blyttiomyces helicus]|uniref:Uncharacterized protein n=1 Tax=Blyttiomyces helicus TaxID=388810 RepID=A0A4P9WNB1_9FUNG|nr:hypothetical protein BDK51DRAFT_46814 [Blyttiomyces helicus]|eukprot:RKO93178.1 hypothetical protein BDK51DRAFT_46814 [Blyttiomyces helicus]
MPNVKRQMPRLLLRYVLVRLLVALVSCAISGRLPHDASQFCSVNVTDGLVRRCGGDLPEPVNGHHEHRPALDRQQQMALTHEGDSSPSPESSDLVFDIAHYKTTPCFDYPDCPQGDNCR